MKGMKKYLKIITLVTSFVLMVFFMCNNVSAAYYDESNNKILSYKLSRDDNEATVSIQYQNGIKDVNVYICETTQTDQDCKDNPITQYQDDTEIVNSSELIKEYTKAFRDPKEGKHLEDYTDSIETDGQIVNNYKVLITAKFCQLRTEDRQECRSRSNDYILVSENTTLATGLTASGDLNKTIMKVLTVVNNYVIPILWLAEAILLIVRGIMLGIDIVKASDEPDVRHKKINGLIWLFIGVFASIAVTSIASYILTVRGYGGYF